MRVPTDSQVKVQVAKLTPEHFDKWESFRNVLLVKTVPLIQTLPRKERMTILQNLQIREFKDGEYICRQGEIGEEFFIIQEGSVKVVERRASPDRGWDAPIDVTLVTLREGHFFGEMSLVTDEPRVASVISVKNTICLCLAKSVFRAALSDETFNEVLNEVLSKRKEIRKQREKEAEQQAASSPNPSMSSPSMRKFSMRSRQSSVGNNEVSVSTTLSMKKLESGSRVINKYVVEKEIGKGSFGDVYLCYDQDKPDQKYAMKIINRPTGTWNDDAGNSIRQEIALLKRLKHPNVVGLAEVIDDQNARKIFLIQEYMEGGALMPDAETCEPLDMATARKYFRDILRGVCYLHSEGIVHRDIKPQNMLLSGDGVVKIADFGAAVFTLEQGKVAFGGTPAFMAPELFLSNKLVDFTKSPQIDIFALGATLYYMVVGRPPWMAKNQIDLATKIKNFELTFPTEGIDPHLKHLLRQMLAKDYRTRCDLDAIVIDDWVTFEGSDPLFEKDEYLTHEFIDYPTFLTNEALPLPIHIIIVHPSLVVRTMLHQQVNNNTKPAMTVGAANAEEAIDIIRTTMTTHPYENFEYIFFELLCPDRRTSYDAIVEIRQLGYRGIIIGMTTSDDTFEDFTQADLVQIVIKRPLANRELIALMSSDAFISMSDKMFVINNTASVDKITREELEASITCNSNALGLGSLLRPASTIMNSSFSSSKGDQTPHQQHHVHYSTPPSLPANGHPPQNHHQRLVNGHSESHFTRSPLTPIAAKDSNDSLVLDDENLQDFSMSAPRRDSSTPDMNRLSLFENKGGLSRKRGFMVVPYGTSGSSDLGDGHANVTFDRPLKIFNVKESTSRRERREKAMQHSALAHQYREAKKRGDIQTASSSKSLLNSFKSQRVSRKSMRSQKFSVNNPPSPHPAPLDHAHQLGSHSNSFDRIHSSHSRGSGELPPISPKTSYNAQISEGGGISSYHMRQSHHRISTSTDATSEKNSDMNLEESDYEKDDIIEDEYSSTSDDVGDTGEETSSSEEDDFGITGDDILQVDETNFNDVFDDIITKKPANIETLEVAEWNHVMIGVELIGKLSSLPECYNPSLNIRCGQAENIVSRSYMEDRSFASIQNDKRLADGRLDCGIFAVFDGHNGDYVAQYLQDHYANTFVQFLNAMEDKIEFSGNDYINGNYEYKISEVFEETNAKLDRDILTKDFLRQQRNLRSGIKDLQKFSGSVGVVAVVMPSRVPIKQLNAGNHTSRRTLSGIYSAQQVFVSHVGDCRAVLSHDGQAVALTEDHKPSLKSEKLRIEQAGGWVDKDRVTGALGVSRSFGDIEYKNFAKCFNYTGRDETLPGGIWGEGQQVISKPDFKHFILERSYEFMILACDGLWDRFSCQEAVNFVRKKLLTVKDVNKVAQMLVEKAIDRGTMDNTSVIIVTFHQ